MPAPEHLNKTLFHGSYNPHLVPGVDDLSPATSVGDSPHWDLYQDGERPDYDSGDTYSRGDHVFMSQTEKGAWTWAGDIGWEDDGRPVPWLERTPVVYEVQPSDHHDPDELGVPSGTMVTDERVADRHQSVPIVGIRYARPQDADHDGQARLPGYNWNAQSTGVFTGNSWDRRERLLDERENATKRRVSDEDNPFTETKPPEPFRSHENQREVAYREAGVRELRQRAAFQGRLFDPGPRERFVPDED